MTLATRVILAAFCTVAPLSVAASQSSLTACELEANGGIFTSTISGVEMTSGRDVTVTCRAKNIVLKADSGQMNGRSMVELFGHVRYSEPSRINLRSEYLTYYQGQERVYARGNVVALLPSGSTLTGPEVTYLRAIPGVRTIEELTAVNNPTMTVAARGDSGKPVTVNARTIFMRGDSLIYASRSVTITRSDLVTHSDSAFLDGRANTETIRLMFKPSVEGLQGRKFKLEGEVIDAYSSNRKLRQVIARGKGHATSQDLEIVADTIDLRMGADAMERAIAWNARGQARATSPSQSISADSLDVVMPKQKVRVVHAIRNARAEAAADTVRFRTPEKDWLRGDTVRAWFDSVTVGKDTSSTPPIKRIFATHLRDSAQAYYHLAPSDTGARRPAISYVRGREIRLDFDDRKVALVTVRDSVAGIYLEPRADSTKGGSAKAGAKGAAKQPASKSPATPAGGLAKPVSRPPIKPPSAAPPIRNQERDRP